MTADLDLLAPAIGALFDSIVRASLQGGLFVLAIWAICRLLPRLPASVKCMLWWLAALKLLVAFVWVDPLPLPLFEPKMDQSAEADAVSPGLLAKRLVLTATGADAAIAPRVETARQDPSDQPLWPWLAVGLWATIVTLLTGSLVFRIRHITQMADRADPASPGTIEMVEQLSVSLGLAKVPGVRVSAEIDTPLVLSFPRPLILVPAHRFCRLSRDQRRMALCHELLHLRRRDPWMAHVPALVERLFFFHPLAHLATRQYELTREAACDAAVLRELEAAPQDYGRLLLTLGVSRVPTPLAAAGSPRSHLNLKRRIVMLRETPENGRRLPKSAWIAAALAACAILPLDFVAKSANAEDTHSVSSPAKPAATAAPAAPAAPHMSKVAAAASKQASELHYVLFLEDDHTMMSGSDKDVARAREFRKSGEPILWFRRAGSEYVVRDAGVLAQAQEIFKPVQEIGSKQGEVGAKQGEVGARQAEVGNKQAAIGSKQAEIGSKQAGIGARQAALAGREARRASRQDKTDVEATQRELDQERQKLESEMDQLGHQMEELSGQMNKFEAPMAELSKEMDVLSQEMNVLSQKMEEAVSKAEAEMSALFDRAVSTGTATAVK